MSTLIVNQIAVRPLREEDLPLLEQMYESFVPRRDASGLPPADPTRRRAWLANLRTGINLVAFADGKMAGHLALLLAGRSAEMALFVHQDFRRQGIATALGRAAVEEARAQGLRFLWVLISSDNSAARAGLLKFGFRTAWESLGEVQMLLPL